MELLRLWGRVVGVRLVLTIDARADAVIIPMARSSSAKPAQNLVSNADPEVIGQHERGDYRFWIAGDSAHRASGAREWGLLRDPSLQQSRRNTFLQAYAPKAIIFSGGPSSVTETGSPRATDDAFKLGVPILGDLLRPADDGGAAWRRG